MEDRSKLSPLKQAFLALEEAQARIEELEHAADEPIALIGLGCRFPANANSPEAFQIALQNSANGIRNTVAKRWSHYVGPLPEDVRWAGLVDGVDQFDPHFFGISPREAAGMDPQQRFLLEVSWEALENAGIAPTSLYGTNAGVYFGLATSDYAQLLLNARGTGAAADAHVASGVAHSVASGRVSYTLGLQGPSLSIDTACSSSLVAVHLACEGLRRRSCDVALAGGVNLILGPEASLAFSAAGMLSSDGRCKAFDRGADGFVRGEGCGVVVLKRLRDAEAAGDRIWAVIRGSAVNQDGPGSGLTVPNGMAQQALMREALRRARVSGRQVSYVEAHGTGTTLGDPIEVEALGRVYGERRDPTSPLWIGSVKTNVGHLEAAAGVAGLIKVALALQGRELLPQLNWTEPSPHIRWNELPARVLTDRRAWTPIEGRRLAGVSAFGFSGTNAHLIVEEAPARTALAPPRSVDVLTISAKTASALERLRAQYVAALQSDLPWREVCRTANAGRAHWNHRLSVSARSTAEARIALEQVVSTVVPAGSRPRVAFWFGAAAGEDFTSAYELAQRWRSWGVSPRAAAGEGVGAWVAAAVDGSLTVEEARQRAQAGEQRLTPPSPEFDRCTVRVPIGEDEAQTLQQLYAAGVEIDWKSWSGPLPPVTLPTYPFERQRYWFEERLVLATSAAKHPLLGVSLGNASQLDWVEEHRIGGSAVMPGAGLVEMLLAAVPPGHPLALEDIVFLEPLRWESPSQRPLVQVEVDEGATPRLRLSSKPASDTSITSLSEAWRLHVEARLGQTVPAQQAFDSLSDLRARCTNPIDRDDFYSALAQRGLDFGPRFHGIKELWRGHLEALGRVEAESSSPGWLLFPPLLDGCLQVAAATLIRDEGIAANALYLPFQIASVHIYAPLGRTVYSHVKVTAFDPQAPSCDLTLFSPEGQRLAVFGGIVFRPAKQSSDVRSWFYGIEWQRAPLPSGVLADVAAALDERVPALAQSLNLAEYNAFFERLEQLSLDYVLASFRNIGVWQENRPPERRAIAPARYPVFENLLNLCVEAGLATREEGAWICGTLPLPVDLAAEVSTLEAQFPFAAAELALVSRCGQQLSAVLTGETEPQQVLFNAESFEQIARVYKSSLPARFFNQLLSESLASLIGSRPGSTLRVLEVGAGTGATTGYVLPLLGRFPIAYLWSDVSSFFVKRARDQFHGVPGVDFRTLDIGAAELPPELLGTFDVVIAANVLHATVRLAHTLGNVHRLLKPSGHLLLLEITGRQRWADITLGLSPDWLEFEDTEVRQDYGILPSGAWAHVLRENGFGEVSTLPSPGNAAGVLGRQELLLARKSSTRAPVCLLLGEERGAAEALQIRGFRVERDTPADWADITHVVYVCPSRTPLDRTAVNEILHLVHTLTERGLTPQVAIVTQSACFGVSDLSQAPVVGLAAAIALELPELRAKCIDLDNMEGLAAELLSSDGESLVAYRNGERCLPRLERAGSGAKRLEIPHGGALERLSYVPAERPLPGPGEVEIAVHATALNFRDVMNATGARSDVEPAGTECAGVITATGPGVTAFQPGDQVSAIAPGCFGTYAIANVLLTFRKPATQSFAEAAALPVAYLTANYCLTKIAQMRPGERILIHAAAGGVGLAAVHLALRGGLIVYATAGSERKRDFLRSLGVEHVFDSRSLDFAREIVEPIDIVLNSLTGAFIDASLSLLAAHGRFVELGKADLRTLPGIAYYPVDLTPELAHRPEAARVALEALLGGVAAGALPQLPVQTFDRAHTVEAFRKMASAQHIGKVVVTSSTVPQRPFVIDPEAAYLITGGLNGLGLRVAEWLVDKGARHLVLTSRRSRTDEADPVLTRFAAQGVQAVTIAADISDRADVARVLSAIGRPLKGIFHCAGTLENAAFSRQTTETFDKVLKPKVDGAWRLHQATAAMPLDCFVLFSSWASLAGSKGQANHCAANAFLDSLAHYRRQQGLPGLSINWGAWSQIGSAADALTQSRFASVGVQPMTPEQALLALDTLLTGPYEPQVGVMPVRWPEFFKQFEEGQIPALYRHFGEERAAVKTESTLDTLSGGLLATIKTTPADRMDRVLLEALQALAGSVLGMRGSDVDPDTGLTDLGMDSLLAVELRNALSTELGRPLPATTFFDYPTIRALTQFVKADLAPPAAGAADASKTGDLDVLAFIESLSDDQAETLLSGKGQR